MVTLKGSDIKTFVDEFGNQINGTPRVGAAASVAFFGKNCRVIFSENAAFDGAILLLRDNATVIIGERSSFYGRMTLGRDSTVTFGDSVYCGWDLQITAAEGADITIGDDVLIAANVRIRTDDSHPIYDGTSGKRLNQSASITIAKHVWIGQESFIMAGSFIGEGCVIGARSMVTQSRPIPPHSLAIGTPAKVQRNKIRWERGHLQRDVIADAIMPIFEAPEPVPWYRRWRRYQSTTQ